MSGENHVIIELLDNNQENHQKLQEFLVEIDSYYPVPLSDKVDLQEYTAKVFALGNVLAAVDEGKIVGAAIFYDNNHVDKQAASPLIGVLRGYRQSLTGFKLARKGIEIVKSRGMKSIYTFTHKDNINAQKFLQRLGFRLEPEIPTRYEYNVSLMYYFD